jgi:tRNA threonylcarbamoyl adenosine modification protein YeaZ
VVGDVILVLDTATSTPVVALADAHGTLVAERRWQSRHRHGEELLQRIDEMLIEAGVARRDLGGVIVGTGPGSFTGLRIGLATGKTIAYALGIPIVGISSTVALGTAFGDSDVTVTLPAGAADRYVHRVGGRSAQPKLVAGMAVEPDVVAIDIETAPPQAKARGEQALAGLAGALAKLGAERLANGEADDVAQVVPAYVALPRGIAKAAAEMEWSPDLR